MRIVSLIIVFLLLLNAILYKELDASINKNKVNSNSNESLLLDDQLVEIFLQEIRQLDLLKNSNYEIINLKISPRNNIINARNFEIEIVDKPHIVNNSHIYIIFAINSDKKKRLRTVKIEAKIQILSDGFCTSNTINKDHIFTDSDIIPCKVNISEIDNFITNSTDIIGKAAKYALKQNSILTTNVLKEPILIKRGEIVDVIYNKNPIKIVFKAEALQNGTKNAFIKVRNLESKKDIVVKVIDASTTIIE